MIKNILSKKQGEVIKNILSIKIFREGKAVRTQPAEPSLSLLLPIRQSSKRNHQKYQAGPNLHQHSHVHLYR